MKSKLYIITLFLFALSFAKSTVTPVISEQAPKTFKAKFETSKGDFEIIAEREYSPLAVDRLYQLIKTDYFNNIIIYRGVKDFVIQFGTVDSLLDSVWSAKILVDEPVIKKNSLGVMSFARAGKDSRGTQLFINLKDYVKLDTVNAGGIIGYPGIAYVTSGLDVVKSICTEYGNAPMNILDSVKTDLNIYLKAHYPNLDYIKKAYVIEE